MENLLTMMTNLPQSIGASTSEDAQTQLDIQQNKMKQQESVSSSDEPKDPYSLLYMFSSMYASVLEDTITSTRILGECNNELRIIKALADMVQLRAKKYNIVQPTIADELEGINVKDLANEQNKLIKLANDRKFAYDTLMATYLDLSLNRSYKALDRTISESMERKKRNNDLLEAEAKNRAVRKDLARRLRLQRNHIKSAGYDTDLTIDGLRTQVEDIGLAAEIRSRYVTRWQVARAEQHHQTIKDKEFSPLMTIELYKTRIDHEQRVHSEVELLINLTINEKLEQVETWMNKYDKDIEKMDLKIQIMKNNHVTTLEERTQLEDTFNKHDKLMKDWVHFKEEREKARLYREKMTNSAITVQAWWRGLLVRLQLGPYKPVKKGKGAKKAKK